MTKVAQTFETYEQWMDREVTLAYVDDQRRHAPVSKYYEADDVKLGIRSIADAQRQMEEDAGGLVAYLMARR